MQYSTMMWKRLKLRHEDEMGVSIIVAFVRYHKCVTTFSMPADRRTMSRELIQPYAACQLGSQRGKEADLFLAGVRDSDSHSGTRGAHLNPAFAWRQTTELDGAVQQQQLL